MIGERTSQGLEVRFRSRGPGRFVGAAFLAFWLCGWAAGECFALWMLGTGVASFVTGQPPKSGGEPMPAGAVIGIGLFLLVWLSFWTLGGVMAMRELLRLVWSEDRLTAHGGGLTIHRTLGPFHSNREVTRDAIRDIVLVPRAGRLVARTDRGNVDLSQLGAREEREQAAIALRRELGVAESDHTEWARLPKEWEEVITPEGERVVTPTLGTKRTQARVAMVVAMVFASVAFLLIREATANVGLVPGAIVLAGMTAAVTLGAIWLARGRMEWRIGSGHLTLRRRFGAHVRDVFEARRLELSSASDSDGDEWFHLDALASGDPEPVTASHHWVRQGSKRRRRIASAMHDATVPKQLGAWLARSSGVTLDDRTTAAAQAIDLAQLRAELEKAGPLGRFAGRLIDGLAVRGRPKRP